MSSPPWYPPTVRLREQLTRLLYVLLLTGALTGGYAQRQPVPSAVLIDRVPAEGLELRQGWRFHAGDLPNGANPRLDDSEWVEIDPVRHIRELPSITRAGIGWLRLNLTTNRDLPPLLMFMVQSVASEVYLDGRLLYRFGTVSTTPGRVRAYNPGAAFGLPVMSASDHLLAVRIACQPGLDFNKKYLMWEAPVVRFTLYPATKLPALRPQTLQAIYLDSFKTGIAFILCILHLSLFVAYRRQRANLYAAGMYGLLFLTFLSRSTVDFVHSWDVRMVLYYGSLIDVAVSGVAILTFYSLYNFPKGWFFWLAIGSVALRFTPLPSGLSWLQIPITYYLQVELIRISIVANRRHLLGARIVTVGVLSNVALWITFSVLSALRVPFEDNAWLYHGLFIVAFLCIPLTLSLRLALENGWVNRQLGLKLAEVEDLAARNAAQQRERQQILARQNEQLEQQVAERTDELRKQTDRLAELNRTRSRFVTNLTHEFRTPLALIISPVEKLLESPELPPTVQTPLQTVDRNARHLLNQVNQLLDIARLEDSHVRLMQQPVRLGHLTAQLVELFESPARAEQIDLRFTSEGDDGPCLMDTDKWGKIVYNLLANALKFTSAGGSVTVQLRQETDQIYFVVSDTGIGIAPDKLPFIFDRFYQADDHPTRPAEGTGVGLALVRELTALMAGNVNVASQPSVGSTFTLMLPRQPAPPGAEPVVETPHRPVAVQSSPNSLITQLLDEPTTPDDERALMLVVEDNADLRAFMVEELSGRYRVLTAADGQEGWEAVQQHLPDVVISDVMMPRMDGFQLTDLIKSTPATDHVAVVLLTARNAHESRLEGLGQGADEYLVKPFDLVELRLRLANLVARQQKLQTHYRQQIEPSNGHASTGAPPPADPFLERLYVLLEQHLDDPRVNVEWLADQLAMDRKTLYRKLQSKLRLSPNALIRLYRLRRAGELLRAGKSITDVAYSVGFESVTYFGHCFKEQYGMTASEFTSQGALP